MSLAGMPSTLYELLAAAWGHQFDASLHLAKYCSPPAFSPLQPSIPLMPGATPAPSYMQFWIERGLYLLKNFHEFTGSDPFWAFLKSQF